MHRNTDTKIDVRQLELVLFFGRGQRNVLRRFVLGSRLAQGHLLSTVFVSYLQAASDYADEAL
ncbi:MAG: hypothetical protein ACRDTV_20740 [Mycobacterium sp.]